MVYRICWSLSRTPKTYCIKLDIHNYNYVYTYIWSITRDIRSIYKMHPLIKAARIGAVTATYTPANTYACTSSLAIWIDVFYIAILVTKYCGTLLLWLYTIGE